MGSSSKHGDGQGIDGIVFGMCPEKFNEDDLSAKVDCDN
jgi:hypothetical protein